jgi:uncharacterized protein
LNDRSFDKFDERHGQLMKSMVRICLMCILAGVGAWPVKAGGGPAGAIQWNAWSPAIFDQARHENRFVLLDLEAVWCHWCHVMDETTYANPEVIALLKSKYLCVRVDQDSRPDLSNRYEDYGWPATVVFNGQGGEIVKRQGYIPPEDMVSMLRAIIADPSPGPSVKASAPIASHEDSGLTPELRAHLIQKLELGYDARNAAWGREQK